ncbi:MAG TPA: PLP-dependent aminotransferase family protein [Solirubrobacteraceae bacterium]|nr:PLP-dependent aminotransferase family protein [Solirubrobacteraceae bacterium]
MPNERTSSSLDLLVSIDRQARTPIRAQLEEQLRTAIRSGQLEPEMALPSTRGLAAALGVTRGLVVECYAQLQAEGYLTALPGARTQVASGAAVPEARADGAELARRPRFDFRPATPDPSLFPRRDWAAACRDTIRDAPDLAFGYGDPRGAFELRLALAGYLGRVRGVHPDPRQVVICAGFTQAENLVWRVLRARGADRVAMEDPGHPAVRRSILNAGMVPVPIPVDELGLCVERLKATEADAVFVTPAHQFPTGAVLAPERRQALRDWARDTGGLIFEDDYDAELRYDRQPIGAIQGLSPDTVVYCGSASKSIGPGLRIGWLVCPPAWLDEIVAAKRNEDRGSPIVDQLALARLLTSGRFDRHLRRVRSRYRSRRDTLERALSELAPHIRLTGIAAGIHAVANLPPDADESVLVAAAAERDVGLYPMSAYRSDHAAEPAALVLGYGPLSEALIHTAIARIADLL